MELKRRIIEISRRFTAAALMTAMIAVPVSIETMDVRAEDTKVEKGSDEKNDFTELLSRIPEKEAGSKYFEILNITAYRRLDGIVPIESIEERSSISDSDFSNATSIFFMNQNLNHFISPIKAEKIYEKTGIDIVKVKGTADFDKIPASRLYLYGDFNDTEIATKMEKEGYKKTEGSYLSLYEHERGKKAFEMDLTTADFEIPFGGEIGQRYPFMMNSELIAYSINPGSFKTMKGYLDSKKETSLLTDYTISSVIETVKEKSELDSGDIFRFMKLSPSDFGNDNSYKEVYFTESISGSRNFELFQIFYNNKEDMEKDAKVIEKKLKEFIAAPDSLIGKMFSVLELKDSKVESTEKDGVYVITLSMDFSITMNSLGGLKTAGDYIMTMLKARKLSFL